VDLISSDESHTYFDDYYYYGYYFDARFKVETMELDAGVRKYWGANKLQGYVGGGLAYLDGEVKLSLAIVSQSPAPGGGGVSPPSSLTLSDSDNVIGGFLNAGGLYRLGRSAQVGIDLRYSDGSDYSFTFSDPFDPGGSSETIKFSSKATTIAIFFGFRWGD
jgi:hypothetical protein